MLTCLDAMVLTDRNGKIVHCNREYAELTGYTLKDIEGLDNATLLSGSMTDFAEMRRCSGLNKLNENSSMCVVNYRKDGTMFANLTTTVPIFGSYTTHGNKILFEIFIIVFCLFLCLMIIFLCYFFVLTIIIFSL